MPFNLFSLNQRESGDDKAAATTASSCMGAERVWNICVSVRQCVKQH